MATSHKANSKKRKKKYHVQPRFFIIIAIFLAILSAGVWGLSTLLTPEHVEWGVLSTDIEVTAVVVRKEQIITADQYARLNCTAAEGESVTTGGEVAKLYTSGYSPKDYANLLALGEKIKNYQQVNILAEIKFADIDNLDAQIASKMEQVASLISTNDTRTLLLYERELDSLMAQRKRFAQDNMQSDEMLNSFYEQEANLQQKIDENIVTLTSPGDGIVSFFFDGHEQLFSIDSLPEQTASSVSTLMKQIAGKFVQTTTSENGVFNVGDSLYRLVDPNEWYLLIVMPESSCTLTAGTTCDLSLSGYDADLLTADVTDIRKEGRKVLCILKPQVPIGNMISLRMVGATIGHSTEGCKVPVNAITQEDGVEGIYVSLDGVKTFVPIQIIASNNRDAIVREASEDGVKLYEDLRIIMP